MNSFKTGLCSVTFRNKTCLEVADIAQRAGVDYIEWGADVHVRSLEDAEKVKKLCEERNIKISSYGSYFNAADYNSRQWDDVLKIGAAMSAESVRIWLGKKDSEKTTQSEYEELVINVKNMCRQAEAYGLLVCPECHDNTFNNNTDAFLRIASQVNAGNFRTYFQSRYFRWEYDLDRIDRTYDYIENVHISYRDLKREQLLRKKDKEYLDRLLKIFADKSFKGIVMIEFVSGNSEQQLMKDMKKLKSF